MSASSIKVKDRTGLMVIDFCVALLTCHTFWPDEWCLPSSSFLALDSEVDHVFVFLKIEPVPFAGIGGVGVHIVRCDPIKVVLDLVSLRGRRLNTGGPLAIVQLLI
jgi:hypothetical protein